MGPPKAVTGMDMTLVSMKTSDRLATLQRLRDRLAEQIDVCPSARDLALLSTRLEAVLSQIDVLLPVEVSAADEIRKRREQRRAKGLPVAIDHTAQGVGREHR
jgi:hypothetical protein